MAINTKKVGGRRSIRYASIDALFADVEQLVAADHAGKLTALGNWPLGTAINHLAVWAEYAYTGVPFQVPWIVRFLTKLMKRRFLTKGLGPGVRFPGVDRGTYGVESLPTDLAFERFKNAFHRLRNEPPIQSSPAFGPLTHDEWIQLHLRHAELHLSFFKPA